MIDLNSVGRFATDALCRVAAKVRAFLGDTRGVSTVEYALIVVAVVAIIGVAAAVLNTAFDELFGDLSNLLNTSVQTTTQAAN